MPFRFGTDKLFKVTYTKTMRFSEVLAELPALTISERHTLVRRALDLDDAGLSIEDEAEVERRQEEHRRNPGSAVPLQEMEARLRARFRKQLSSQGGN